MHNSEKAAHAVLGRNKQKRETKTYQSHVIKVEVSVENKIKK